VPNSKQVKLRRLGLTLFLLLLSSTIILSGYSSKGIVDGPSRQAVAAEMESVSPESFARGAKTVKVEVSPEVSDETTLDSSTDTQMHYFESRYKTGLDNGYTEEESNGGEDCHLGWSLGRFFVSGFTGTKDTDGNIIFLKTTGDKITLGFVLNQNIDSLNDDESLKIAEDKNGYDEYFQVSKTDFGRGMLIVRHTDYQNNTYTPVKYSNFLSALEVGAETEINTYEEGDYEVALDYEIESDGFLFLKDYANYQIYFKFSVRNGNSMVFPFDVATNNELTNNSITNNGFYLDLAKSRYLDIVIKREVFVSGSGGVTEDTRFNRPARDGEEYTEEGLYTIGVRNRYTDQTTEKKIFVGTDASLNAYLDSGIPLTEYSFQPDNGTEADAGNADGQSSQSTSPDPQSTSSTGDSAGSSTAGAGFAFPGFSSGSSVWMIVGAIALVVALLTGVMRSRREKKANPTVAVIEEPSAHELDSGQEDKDK
jgi:hypothetical protein